MKTRLALLVGMPTLFLAIVLGLYLGSGIALLLHLRLAVLAIGGVAVGMLLALRREVASCFHLEDDRVRIGRPWPYRERDLPLADLRLRHLGALLYRIESRRMSLVFDKSRCNCMSDEEFATMATRLGATPAAGSA